MPRITVRFHAELEDFLPPSRRGKPLEIAFRGPQTVKHLVEAAGVPHVEIGAVRAQGQALPLGTVPPDGIRLEVFPRAPRERWPADLPSPRFALDGHLGRLASYLRLLGFDTAYRNEIDDADLAAQAVAEGRVVLTRDQDLLKRKALRYGYWVRATDPRAQVAEVLERFDIAALVQPFTRCPRCNGLLAPVPKAEVLAQLEPLTRRYYDTFYRCQACGQVYWRGSHFDRILTLLHQWLPEKPLT